MFKIAHSPIFCHAVPEGHRFPMAKYERLPLKLIADGIATPSQFFEPPMATIDEILTTHTQGYWHALDTLTLPAKDCRTTVKYRRSAGFRSNTLSASTNFDRCQNTKF